MGRIVIQAKLKKILRSLRQKGKKIVFTNGCFDLLHAGHVTYLEKAKRLGDVLVVGLNSDSSVRRLKGKQRPILKQADRAKIITALACVDYVMVFAQDTPLNLIKSVRPDILVKGADYKTDKIVGTVFVQSYGGKVRTIPLVRNKSSRSIISSILRRYRKI